MPFSLAGYAVETFRRLSVRETPRRAISPSRRSGLDLLRKLQPRPVQAGLERILGNAQGFSRFLSRQPLDVAQQDGGPHIRRKLGEVPVEQPPQLLPGIESFRVRRGIGELLGQ